MNTIENDNIGFRIINVDSSKQKCDKKNIKIVALSDIEIYDKDIENNIIKLFNHNIKNLDYIISCGDVHKNIFYLIRDITNTPIIGVAGNHDNELPKNINNLYNLHFKNFKFNGISFGGFGGAWKYKPRGRNLYLEEEVKEYLKLFPYVDIFVTHNPMKGVNDIEDDIHNGFSSFRNYCKQKSIPIFLHGHSGLTNIKKINDTLVIGLKGLNYIDLFI